jgi:hypothetical protein
MAVDVDVDGEEQAGELLLIQRGRHCEGLLLITTRRTDTLQLSP